MSAVLGSVLAKTLRDQRRGLLGWSVGLLLVVGLMAAVWPSVRDMPDLEQFLANYPEAMKQLFNIEALGTGAGYLNAELFSIVMPALFIVYGIARGAKLIAGEEDAGTLELTLTSPLPRWRVAVEKAAGLAVGVGVLAAVLAVATLAASALLDMGVGVGDVTSAALAMLLLGLLHGWVALAVGAASGRRSLAVAVPGMLAVGGYLLYALAGFVEALEPWRVVSPFHQALANGPLGAGLPLAYAWMPLVAAAALAAALPLFAHRDVSA